MGDGDGEYQYPGSHESEGALMDEAGMTKARQQGIPIFRTENPIFETALQLYRWIKEDAGAIGAEGTGRHEAFI